MNESPGVLPLLTDLPTLVLQRENFAAICFAYGYAFVRLRTGRCCEHSNPHSRYCLGGGASLESGVSMELRWLRGMGDKVGPKTLYGAASCSQF